MFRGRAAAPRPCFRCPRPFLLLLCCGLLLAHYPRTALAELQLPEPLTALTSPQGERLLQRGLYVSDAFLLLENFVSQINSAFCGIATSAMLLNSLGVGQPLQAADTWLDNPDYAFYNQVNIFSNETEGVKPQKLILQEGLSLKELSLFMAAHAGVNSTYRHSRGMSLDEFRSLILSALAQPQCFVSVNFQRRDLQEVGGGHHSPVAAYNQETDQVLVLDVSRYKYPAWWCPVAYLYDSVLPEDPSDLEDPGRGLAFAWSPPEAGPRLGPAFITPTLDDGAPIPSTDVPQHPLQFSSLQLTAVVACSFAAGLLLVLVSVGVAVHFGAVHVGVGRRGGRQGDGSRMQAVGADAEMAPLFKRF